MKDPVFVSVLLLSLFAALITMFFQGYWAGIEFMEREAVKHNGAKWAPNEHGKPIFQWNQ